MKMLDVKPIKTYIKEESEDSYKIIQLSALSNGQFDIDIFDVTLFPEGWYCDEEPDHSVRFDDFFSADKHLGFIAFGLCASDNHDIHEAVPEMLEKDAKDEFQADKDFRKRQLVEKQAEHDKEPKYEATCRETGERMVFSADTEEKALNLAEMCFPGGILRIERVRTKVKFDEWDY